MSLHHIVLHYNAVYYATFLNCIIFDCNIGCITTLSSLAVFLVDCFSFCLCCIDFLGFPVGKPPTLGVLGLGCRDFGFRVRV